MILNIFRNAKAIIKGGIQGDFTSQPSRNSGKKIACDIIK